MSKLNMTMENVFAMLKTHKDNEYKAIYVQVHTNDGLKLIKRFSVYEEYDFGGCSNNTLEPIYNEMSYYEGCYEFPVESVAFHTDGTVFINLEGREN